jgi:hypothetical protein
VYVIQVKSSLQRVSSPNLISCATGFDYLKWRTVFRECFPLPQRNGVGYTDKVPHSFHWTTNFYVTTVELILEGSSPKLHPFRHGELLKASTKESKPSTPPLSCHAARFQWTRFVASSVVRFNWMFGHHFYLSPPPPSLCCDWLCLFLFLPLFRICVCSASKLCLHQTCVMQCTVKMVEVWDFDIIIVFQFVSSVCCYVFVFRKWMGGRGMDSYGGLLWTR